MQIFSSLKEKINKRWLQKKWRQGRIPWGCHKINEKPASISNILSLWSRVFCSDSSQNKVTEETGHKQHPSGVTVSHHPQMGPSSCRKTSPRLPLILHYGLLYNYFLVYYNVIITEIKYTLNLMHLNHPKTISSPPLVHRKKLSSMKLVPGAKKAWDHSIKTLQNWLMGRCLSNIENKYKWSELNYC